MKGIIIVRKLTRILTITLVMVTVLLVSVTGNVLANQRIEGDDYGIEVSPNTLNIYSNGNAGNIHSNIPYTDLTVVSLKVTVNDNDEEIDFSTSQDDLGDLVVTFDIDDVKDILSPEVDEATFALTCFYVVDEVVGDSFTVYDYVPVISVP